jgi:glucose 1-dehydrogenase
MSHADPVRHAPAKLAGHVALVTGAGSGIGRASAVAFAREGAAVVINYLHDEADAEETRRQVEEAGGSAVVVQADVGVEEEVERLFARVEDALGPVTLLMNNAGADASGTHVADLSLDDWSKMIASNLTGPFLCARRFIRAARAHKASGQTSGQTSGKIINVTSVHEDVPRAGGADYCATKGGLRNLTRCLALELAEDKITVNNLAPGMVLTPMNQAAIDDPALLDQQVQSIPFKRAARPEEIAALAVYLASRDADYVTGTTIFIDGGLMRNMGQGA